MTAEEKKSIIQPWMMPVAIFATAFAIRLFGVQWSLPNEMHYFTYHPDESQLLAAALNINLLNGVWDPHFYNYGSFYIYLNNIAIQFANAFALADGAPLHQQLSAYILWMRIANCLFGASAAVAAYAIAARFLDKRYAWIAGAVLAASAAHVVHSRFQTVDIPAVFFISLALLFAIKLYQEEKLLKNVVACGLFIGLAAGIKYNAFVVFFALATAALLLKKPLKTKMLIILVGLLTACLAFIVVTPGAVFNFSAFMRDVNFERMHVTNQAFDLTFQQTAPGWIYHAYNLWTGLNPLLLLVGVAGWFTGTINKRKETIIIAVFGIAYYAMISFVEIKYLRYTFPLYPLLAVGCALACRLDERFMSKSFVKHALRVMVIIGIGFMFSKTVLWSIFMSYPDPRDIAMEYVMQQPKHITLGLVKPPWFYSPPVSPWTNMPGYMENRTAEVLKTSRIKLATAFPPDWNSELITKQKPDLIIINQFEYVDEARLGLKAYAEFQTELNKRYVMQASIGGMKNVPHDLLYIYPKVEIWKRR